MKGPGPHLRLGVRIGLVHIVHKVQRVSWVDDFLLVQGFGFRVSRRMAEESTGIIVELRLLTVASPDGWTRTLRKIPISANCMVKQAFDFVANKLRIED